MIFSEHGDVFQPLKEINGPTGDCPGELLLFRLRSEDDNLQCPTLTLCMQFCHSIDLYFYHTKAIISHGPLSFTELQLSAKDKCVIFSVGQGPHVDTAGSRGKGDQNTQRATLCKCTTVPTWSLTPYLYTFTHTHTRPGVAILSKRAFIPPLLGKLPWKQTRTWTHG